MNSDQQYWAFISYSSKDKKWGQWLHKRLENYPIPEEFQGQELFDGAVLGKNLRPVFRDRDELAGSSELGPAIERALQSTRFLIVLCSKNSAQSEWVNKEIADFKAMGKEGNILALILDGEPNATSQGRPEEECFPPELRYPAEPLAGDLRKEGDGKERGFLKILAGIAQLDFDKLYRRHERAQARKRLVAGLSAAALTLLFAGLSIFAFNQRHKAEQREAEALIQLSRSYLEKATDALRDRKDNHALAYAVSAARTAPDYYMAKVMLFHLLLQRDWPVPIAHVETPTDDSGPYNEPTGDLVYSDDGRYLFSSFEKYAIVLETYALASTFPEGIHGEGEALTFDMTQLKTSSRESLRERVPLYSLAPDPHIFERLSTPLFSSAGFFAIGRYTSIDRGVSGSGLTRRQFIDFYSLSTTDELRSLQPVSSDDFSSYDELFPLLRIEPEVESLQNSSMRLVSPSGRWLVDSGLFMSPQVYEVIDGTSEKRHELFTEAQDMFKLELTSDEQYLYVSARSEKEHLHKFRIETGELMWPRMRMDGDFEQSQDDLWLIVETVSGPYTHLLLDAETGGQVFVLPFSVSFTEVSLPHPYAQFYHQNGHLVYSDEHLAKNIQRAVAWFPVDLPETPNALIRMAESISGFRVNERNFLERVEQSTMQFNEAIEGLFEGRGSGGPWYRLAKGFAQ